jgi:uncharacterized protein YjbI with pentapeptide repeats
MKMKLRSVALGLVIGALLTAGVTFGVTEASASGPNVTYYACLKSGKLTHVGTTSPTCAVGAVKISWNSQGPSGTNGTNGTNGKDFLTSSSTPTGACNTGDIDLALDSDELWTCLAGVWSDTGSNVKGAPASVLDCAATPYPGIDLAGCVLEQANLSSASMPGADLAGADLAGATLSGAILTGANMSEVNLNEIKGRPPNPPIPATLSNADLEGANLTGASVSRDVANNANFADANLGDAEFADTDLSGADLEGATVTGADFGGVTWASTICPDGTNSDTDGGTCLNNF